MITIDDRPLHAIYSEIEQHARESVNTLATRYNQTRDSAQAAMDRKSYRVAAYFYTMAAHQADRIARIASIFSAQVATSWEGSRDACYIDCRVTGYPATTYGN